jgi:hypothetical protein
MKHILPTLFILIVLVQNAYAKFYGQPSQLIPQLLEEQLRGFSSLEHQEVSNKLTLHFYDYNPKKILHLPNGLALTYSQIVMLAGDLLGDPQHPISNCKVDEREKCFNLQFYALAGNKDKEGCENPRTQVLNLIDYYEEINVLLTDWRLQGKMDWEFYKEYGSLINKKLNRLTCGGSFISDYIPFGNYLRLSANNFDHFQPDSLIAYKIGHQVALETALVGYKQKTQGNHHYAARLLELAYAQNAFANHFLSDSFASGHLRTPRRELDQQVKLPAIFNLLLANLMHDEDNRLGLNVVNEEGTSLIVYGDNYLFTQEAELQRIILIQAMQRSVDSIYDSFISGKLPNDFIELKLVPLFEKIGQMDQSSPLFKVENGILLKRKDSHNPNDFEWTADWSGLFTLLEFGG